MNRRTLGKPVSLPIREEEIPAKNIRESPEGAIDVTRQGVCTRSNEAVTTVLLALRLDLAFAEAADGEEDILLAQRLRPDVIFMDTIRPVRTAAGEHVVCEDGCIPNLRGQSAS